MKNILAFLAGGFGVILMLGIGLAQMVIGYIGIEYHFGAGWAIGAVVLALMFRFSFPLTIGTFFGAMDVFGFSFIVALLITLPGLLLMVPGAIAAGIAGLASSFNSKPNQEYQPKYNYDEPKNVTPTKTPAKKTKSLPKKTKKVTKKKKAKKI
ncbi:MAG: hypothetical protein HOK38_03870 [Flavobacteriaceae bacterium]|jgi:hypothetical protein|nr:hypothetical protein [Flavobacteriaceae bacterium]|tara:strand:- start:136 stop:594 length:459 start_codon:yes stop_codon:yes gene_type:complete